MTDIQHLNIRTNLDEAKEPVTPFEIFFDNTVKHFDEFVKTMMTKDDHITPTIYMKSRAGKNIVILMETPPADLSPADINFSLKELLTEQDAMFYVLVAEATQKSTSIISDPESIAEAKKLNGKEVVIFTGGDDTGMSLSASYTREEEDGHQKLVESIPRNRGMQQGGLANLLNVNRTLN